MSVSQLYAQTRRLSGTILDENNNPVQGVTIIAVGATSSATTNASGTFSLNVPSGVRQVEISHIGYATQRLAIPASGAISIKLVPGVASLEDVVVTGYGRQNRSTYSGAVTKVDKKAIEMIPMGSFDQILQGRVPGLVVTSSSGQPGASATVTLRGVTTILGADNPLYVVDGIPVEPAIFQSYNPNDFESVDVLKDAAASALYGSRGAAGVIVVTTKRGRAGRTVLNYKGQVGMTTTGTQEFEMMNSAELLKFQEKLGSVVPNGLPGWTLSSINPANAGLTTAQKAANARMLDSLANINTNWKDVFFRKGVFTSHDLSLSGGTDRTRFFASVGNYKEDGIAERSNIDRKTFRLNLDHSSDKLTFSLSSGVGYTMRNQIESEGGAFLVNPYAAVYLALPYEGLYNPNGSIAVGAGKVGANAFARIFDTEYKVNQLKGNLNGAATYNLTPNIYVGGQAGLDYRQTYNIIVTKPATFTAFTSNFPEGPSVAGDTSSARGSYLETDRSQINYQVRAFAGFKKVFASKHNFDGNINVEYLKKKTRGIGFQEYGLNAKLPISAANYTAGTVGNQLIPALSNPAPTDVRLFSVFGIAKYTYNDRYTLDLTLRNDMSSLLPEQNRSKAFYAVGATWNVMKENFTANWRMINTFRVRASYGTSANANNFPLGVGGYYSTFAQGSYAGLPTWAENNPGNPNADWEYTNQLNVGADFGFFNSRLTGSVDVYNKITNNVYLNLPISQPTGAAAFVVPVNSGVMTNRGVEVLLSYDVIRNRNFTWNIGGNFAHNKNRITDLGGEDEFFTGFSEIAREGLPYGSYFLTKWAGVDAATGSPLYYTKEGKLTTRYSDDDNVADFGTFYAPNTGGFNTSLRYKGLELSAFFSFAEGNQRFNRQNFFQMNPSFAVQGFNLRKEMLTMWTKPGDVTNIQSPATQTELYSSKYLEDGSYLRFRNLTIGYTIPKSILGRQKYVTNIRVFGQAQNLYTWTKYTGFDPEGDDDGSYEYPLPRIYTLGIDVSF
jgi:TonB-linked SusC/RagA family outer membrane protein